MLPPIQTNFAACILLILGSFFLASCSNESSNFVWKLDKAEKAIYIVGVTHITFSRYATLPGYLEKIYARSVGIGYESINQDAKKNDARGKSAGNAIRNIPLDNEVSVYLDSLLKKGYLWPYEVKDLNNSTSFELMDAYRLIQDNVIESGLIKKSEYAVHGGLEISLLKLNQKYNKPIHSLESFELAEQLWVKNCSHTSAKLDILKNAEIAAIDSEFEKVAINNLIVLAAQGDEVLFKKEYDNVRQRYPFMNFIHQCGYRERQEHWIQKLNTFVNQSEGDLLFMVGIGHFFAEPTLIELAKADGFTVHRVYPDGRLEAR